MTVARLAEIPHKRPDPGRIRRRLIFKQAVLQALVTQARAPEILHKRAHARRVPREILAEQAVLQALVTQARAPEILDERAHTRRVPREILAEQAVLQAIAMQPRATPVLDERAHARGAVRRKLVMKQLVLQTLATPLRLAKIPNNGRGALATSIERVVHPLLVQHGLAQIAHTRRVDLVLEQLVLQVLAAPPGLAQIPNERAYARSIGRRLIFEQTVLQALVTQARAPEILHKRAHARRVPRESSRSRRFSRRS